MDVMQVVLSTGRQISLAQLEIRATYGGFAEGYPCASVNDIMILAPARQPQVRFGGVPSHVIEPERSYPEADEPPGPQGPVELLPAFECTGLFCSQPVGPATDAARYESRLAVTWFEPNLEAPVAEFVAAAVASLDWESLAEDRQR